VRAETCSDVHIRAETVEFDVSLGVV